MALGNAEEFYVGIPQPIPENLKEYIENFLDLNPDYKYGMDIFD